MRKLFFLLFISAGFTASSQNDLSKKIDELQKSAAKQRLALDSMQKATDSFLKKQMKRNDSIEMARFNEQNTRNLNSFVRGMQERNRKQKRAMWLRLFFGVALLGVGIYGVLRKRKKKQM